MSDQTAGGMAHHGHRVPKAEFFVYFAMIFTLALPVQMVAWLTSLLWHLHMPASSPLRRAWADAASITPQIFRG
jgi:hypothetical protein